MQVINIFSLGDVTADELGHSLNELNFVDTLHSFTAKHNHAHSISDMSPIYDSDDEPPKFDELITLYPSAVTKYFAPSDLSGIGGMHSECVCATHIWRKEGPHYDTVFVNTNSDEDSMHGLDVTWVRQFFSFRCQGCIHPCAVIQWYSHYGDEPYEGIGMWVINLRCMKMVSILLI